MLFCPSSTLPEICCSSCFGLLVDSVINRTSFYRLLIQTLLAFLPIREKICIYITKKNFSATKIAFATNLFRTSGNIFRKFEQPLDAMIFEPNIGKKRLPIRKAFAATAGTIVSMKSSFAPTVPPMTAEKLIPNQKR